MVNTTPQHKLIIVEDIGRDLNAIGYGFKSPIMSPFKAHIDVVRRLLTESSVTKMYEVHEKDITLRVKLDVNNFRQSFDQLWKEQNPDKVFPWEKDVRTVETTAVKSNDDNSLGVPVPVLMFDEVETPVINTESTDTTEVTDDSKNDVELNDTETSEITDTVDNLDSVSIDEANVAEPVVQKEQAPVVEDTRKIKSIRRR